jgi:hypothetical protein
MKLWAKHHEILYGGSWISISFWRYIWFNIIGNITCISEGYPSPEKDRGFNHSAPRQEY